MCVSVWETRDWKCWQHIVGLFFFNLEPPCAVTAEANDDAIPSRLMRVQHYRPGPRIPAGLLIVGCGAGGQPPVDELVEAFFRSSRVTVGTHQAGVLIQKAEQHPWEGRVQGEEVRKEEEETKEKRGETSENAVWRLEQVRSKKIWGKNEWLFGSFINPAHTHTHATSFFTVAPL